MEGDCNSDSDCLDGLKCGNNNCNENSGNWDSSDDCCYKPKGKFIMTILSIYLSLLSYLEWMILS